MAIITKKDILRALSNKVRLRLIVCLKTPQNVTELLEKCSLSQSALSQHLKILKDCEVATCKKEGKQQIYVVTDEKIINITKQLLKII